MGLTNWQNSKGGGMVLKTDVSIAKNYLNEDEIQQLNRLVELFLNYAELQVTIPANVYNDSGVYCTIQKGINL